MKKFAFSLQKVLEYKTHLEDVEKEILCRMREQQAALCRQADAVLSRERVCIIECENCCAAGIAIEDLVFRRTNIEQLRRLHMEMMERIRLMQADIDRQVEKLLVVSRDKTSIEKLRQKQLEEYQQMEMKENEAFIEEFVKSASFMTQQQVG